MNPPLFGTTCTRLTLELSKIAYMKPTFSHFSTFFSNYFFHYWIQPSLMFYKGFSIFLQQHLVHTDRRTDSFQIFYRPRYCFLVFFLRTFSSFFSSSLVNPVEMMTSLAFSGCKKAYFKCSGNSFIINPSELVCS